MISRPLLAEPSRVSLPTWLSVALVALASLTLGAWLVLAAVHMDDTYRIDHASGSRIALARYFVGGSLYPALYDGQTYGGTRYMPLPIVLHGVVAQLTGEYLTSGKVINYAITLALLATMFVILVRRLACPRPIALALVASVIATTAGLAGTMGLRGEVLPLFLQLLAIAAVEADDRPAGAVAAGGLSALALVSQLSAVWAPLAIAAWLLFDNRRRLGWFLLSYGALAGTLLLVFSVASNGRLFENVFGLATAGVGDLSSLLSAPYRLVHLVVDQVTITWALLPFAGVLVWRSARDRQFSIYSVALVAYAIVLVVVFTDIGTGWNQLIGLTVLTALVTGELVGAERAGLTKAILPVLALALVWLTGTGVVVNLVPDLRAALSGTSFPREPLAGRAGPTPHVLAENPYVPVSLGQHPVVLDPFMLLRLGRKHPEAVQDLIDRIEGQEFDLVVLVEPLEPIEREWWDRLHFGREVVEAMARWYSYAGQMHGYYLYEPVEKADGVADGEA